MGYNRQSLPNPRRQAAAQEYQYVQEAYEDRRNAAADGLGLQYDESQFGQSIFDVDNPIEHDPNLRKEVFSEMGAALRQQLLDTRGLPASERVYVERRDSSPSAPQTIRQARQVVTQARAQHALNNDELYTEDGRYAPVEPVDEYDDGGSYPEEEYETPARYPGRQSRPQPQRYRDRYEALEPAEEVFDEDDEEESDDWEATYQSRRAEQAQARTPASQRHYPQARPNGRRYPAESDRSVRSPTPQNPRQVRDRGYSPNSDRQGPNNGRSPYPQQPQRTQQPDRRTITRPPVSPRPVRRDTPSESRRSSRTELQGRQPVQRRPGDRTAAVTPSLPEFLGPDGRIPRNPCGAPLYTSLGPAGEHIAVECQEERRGTAPPWHVNMPHMARIADPNMNAANACFIWYYKEEVPT